MLFLDESDLVWAEQNAAKVLPKVVKYLQAEWETVSSLHSAG